MTTNEQKLNDEWTVHLQRVGSFGTPRDFNRAVLWVLVNVFGGDDIEDAMREYHYDPLFHTQVNTAAQMIERLSDLTAAAREQHRAKARKLRGA